MNNLTETQEGEEVERLRSTNVAMCEELDAANAGLHHLKKNNDVLRAELDSLKSDMDVLRDKNEMLKSVYYGNLQAISHLTDELDALSREEPVALVTSSGVAGLPLLQWVSADHSFRVNVGDELFSRPVPAIPEGMALVPVEPTNQMLEDCGTIANYAVDEGDPDADHIAWYQAMIAAAQKGGV